jgi:hypothetical protein
MLRFAPTLLLALASAPVLAQVPCFDSNLGTNLALGDDAFSGVLPLGFTFTYAGTPYTDVQVCSNGYLVFGNGAPGAADASPTVLELLNNLVARVAPLWMDWDPTSGFTTGGVFARAVPQSGSTPAYFAVTWDRVVRYNTQDPHTMQIRLVDGGAIELFLDGSFTQGQNLGNWLVGVSPGNGAATNQVAFASLPFSSGSSPVMHQNGANTVPFHDVVMRWTPNSAGGFDVASAPGCASQRTFGSGCVRAYASFYEHFPISTQFDLANTALSGLFNGSGYVMLPGLTSFVPPSGTATSLGLGDDATTTVALSAPLAYPGGSVSTLHVCSNGFIATGPSGTGYQPTPAAFLTRGFAAWNVWHDFICNASNNVWFEEVGGVAYLTWDNVLSYQGLAAGVTPSTFQFQFELATGNFHIVFSNMDATSVSGYQGGDGYLVGFSPGGVNADPGNTDLSTALAGTFQTFASDTQPLRLSATGRPVLGTTMNVDVANIPAGTPFGAVLFGFVGYDPGISLASIGMAGCSRYVDGLATRLFVAPGSTHSVPFAVPNNAAFVGVEVFSQGVSFSPPLTALGAIASNGLSLRLGR